MFSSKTPRDLNHDPEPYLSGMGNRHATNMSPAVWINDPRPEFDHVQHNEPNPILVDLRQHYRGDWAVMLKHFNYVTFAAGHYVTKDWERITEGRQIDHARRVLTRLAALSKEQS